MKFYKIIEYLLYVSVFILIFKFSEAATINRTYGKDNDINNDTIIDRDSKNFDLGSCADGLSWMCIKLEFGQYMENLAQKDEIMLFPGVEIVKDNDVSKTKSAEIFADIARNYPNDPSSRLNGYIITHLTNYMQTHSLRLKLVDNNTISEARSLSETGRSKHGKKGGGMEALMAAGIVMKGTLMALALGALALLAGKALTTALIALLLAGLTGLKSMDGGKETKNVIIAKHHTHDSHAHGHSGYADYQRNFQLEKPSR